MIMLINNNWQLKFFEKSMKKKVKFMKLESILSTFENKRCLNVGCGTGAIDYYLRKKGGTWISLDLDNIRVKEAKKLVGNNVLVGNATSLCFKPKTFDCVFALDIIEHIEEDETFLKEVSNVLKPRGELYISTPNTEGFLLINRIANLIGLTDETREHVRPGYTSAELSNKLRKYDFAIESITYYSKFFTELIQLPINYYYFDKNKRMEPSSDEDVTKNKKILKIFNYIHPLLWSIARLDCLLRFNKGYGIIIKSRKGC